MKAEDQRLAIATACGWKWDGKFTVLDPSGNRLCSNDGEMGLTWKQACLKNKIPDYLNDLNAMHKAENSLELWQHEQFRDQLAKQVAPHYIWAREHYHMLRPYVSATAKQRAEAFLRTLGLWTP